MNNRSASDVSDHPGDQSAHEPTYDDAALWQLYARDRRRSVRNELVEANLGLAAHIARRYSGRGIDEDLRQVAFLALVKAVERFDVSRGVPFSAFAGRTIEGELKRHFRDTTWTLRVPRAIKERSLYIAKLGEQLAQQLGRSPTVAELAEYLEISTDEVVEAVAAGGASTPSSLDAADEDRVPAALGEDDAALLGVQDAVIVDRLLEVLPQREREIVRLRYYLECSQAEIAERVGISQMHVSRLLRRSLEAMRLIADNPAADPSAGDGDARAVGQGGSTASSS
ncbi:N/A [soil metagenome]